jgi:hypothetical protein
MREPSPQIRLLASPPVFYGSWGLAIWLLYHGSQDNSIWLLLIMTAVVMTPIMKADQQVKAYKAWKRDWDAMSGTPARRPMHWSTWAGMALGVPLVALLCSAGQQGGTQAVLGVILLLTAPLAVFGLLAKLFRWLRHRQRVRDSQVRPVAVCVTQPLYPAISLRDAYHGLPDHCLRVMRPLA